ncbi:hypothetical protein ACHAPC_003182 [Botrytis cinerea]
MAAKNTETVAKKKRARPKKIILDISATFSLSDILTSKAKKSEGLKFGINSTWAIRRVSESERKASPSPSPSPSTKSKSKSKSKYGTSAIVAAIASAPTTTEDSEKIAIPAISTAIVAIPATTEEESDVKFEGGHRFIGSEYAGNTKLQESIFSDRKHKYDDSFSDNRTGAACPKHTFCIYSRILFLFPFAISIFQIKILPIAAQTRSNSAETHEIRAPPQSFKSIYNLASDHAFGRALYG